MSNLTTLTAEKKMFDGLKKYSDKRCEFLTLSITKKTENSITKYFQKFIDRVEYNFPKFSVVYIGVIVDDQHLHVLIRKPFIKIEWIRLTWLDITGEQSHVTCKTVRGDKSDRVKMDRLVTYIIAQGNKHNTGNIRYIQSKNWLPQSLLDDGELT